jgi:predicted ribosome quality control (RQC) complex YloA/Tae2 family protein
MLNAAEVARAASILEERFQGARVEKIVEAQPFRIQLSLYVSGPGDAGGGKHHLLLCCAPQTGRVSELPRSARAPEAPPRFAQVLKPRLDGARLRAAVVRGDLRQLALRFEGKDGIFELVLSLMGNRSNLYLLDAEGVLRAALRPLEQTRRSLSIGLPFADPPPRASADTEEPADRFAECEDDAYLAALEAHYAPLEAESDAESRKRRVLQVLRKEAKLAKRRLDRIESELAEADDAGRFQREGEVLKGSLSKVPAGASEVTLQDYESGEAIRIALDATLSPQQNLARIFKRYQKLVRRLTKAGGQVDEARARVASVEAMQVEVAEQPAGSAAFDAFLASEAVKTLLRRHAPPKIREAVGIEAPKLPGVLRGVERRLLPRRYASRDGLEIWVGRSDEGNDHLTTRLARGKDLFFHLDGAPGSHVILRTGGRSDPPPDSLLDAAELAVHFSKEKNASSADVHIVPIKQVKKPKGAKKGLVMVTGGRSLHLRREPSRLKRVLDARIEG